MSDRVSFGDVLRSGVGLISRAPRIAKTVHGALLRPDFLRESLGSWLETAAKRHPDRTAVLYEDDRWTYRELNRAVNRWARWLRSRGVQPGDAVAVQLLNRPELLIIVGALARLGAVASLINTQQRGDVLLHSYRVSNAAHILVDAELADSWEEVSDRCDVPADVVDTQLCNRVSAESSAKLSGPVVRRRDPAFYIFTSGTTGLPKASIMSHGRWIRAGHLFGTLMMELTPRDVIYSPLPLYHNMALTVGWASAVLAGAAFAIRKRFSASAYWDDCRRFQATAITYIGELPRYLLAQPPRPEDREHTVKSMVGVGLRPDVWRPFKARFGVERVCENYSSSETNAVFMNLLNLDETIGFCPTPHRLVRFDVDAGEIIRDAKGAPVEAKVGEPGLLVTKVTMTQKIDGYTDAAATEKKLMRDLFRRGDTWFNSGDILKKVGWGHAVFVDRVGDTFRWKGENVSTGEVEKALHHAGGVEEATVYGVEVPGHDGRAGMAAVVGDPDPAALATHLLGTLPRYAVPVFVRLRAELSHTGTFKQQKGGLRKEGWRDSPDPLWVLCGTPPAYTPLTVDLRAQLEAATLRV